MTLQLATADRRVDRSEDLRGTRKSRSVYEALKRQIIVGDLTPDCAITEQALAQEFGCSQSTVREALLTLQEDGLVVRRGYRGTFVTETSDEEAGIMLRLRLNIEQAAIGKIVGNVSEAVLCQLRDLASLHDERRLQRNAFGVAETDIDFHILLLRAAEMPLLEPTLQRTLLHLHRFIVTHHQYRMDWAKDPEASHTALIDAIGNGDRAKADGLIVQHVGTHLADIDHYIAETVFAAAGGTHAPDQV